MDGCPHWWYSVDDGLCRDDAWKKAALGCGIAGILFALALAGTMICMLVKDGTCGREGCCCQWTSLAKPAPPVQEVDALLGME